MRGIEILTKRDVIKGVRERWNAQYSHCEPSYEIGPRDNKEPVAEETK